MGTATPEGRIKARLKAMLKRLGVWYYMPGNNGFGTSGIPDVIAIVCGRFVGIEVKSGPTKKPTALQLKCASDIQAAGGKWFLVYDDATIGMVEDYITNACHRESQGTGPETGQPGTGA
jgi:hypothetical protein